MNHPLLASWVSLLFALTAGGLLAQTSSPAKQTNTGVDQAAGQIVGEFITAFHRADYRRALDLTHDLKDRIAGIQANQPKILWGKLIEEMYAPMIDCVPRTFRYKSSGNVFDNPGGCMPQSLIDLIFWFPKSVEWEVVETRPTKGFSFSSGDFNGTEVYLKVRYPSIADAPRRDGYFEEKKGSIRETIFSVLLWDGLVAKITNVKAGDVLYTDQPVSTTGTPGSKEASPVSTGSVGAVGTTQGTPLAPTPKETTDFTIRNENDMFPAQVYFDGEKTPIRIKVNSSYTVKFEVGSTHAVRVVQGFPLRSTRRINFTVTSGMGPLRVTPQALTF